ncbi:3-hydroxyacyl-CoA dehydrogenase family protein [Modestobacter sp. I12A-02628]|uniref:3-hydroxyacyl-CoA dehydrogenase family protein n=1 Tax=Goekera deserti TaxID=2497753 RepID=A0A7K3W7G9_9ACTN|nr:3-hydroxybutyryl-CoA dehydrogenase [Goekera deserti]MPQ99952.1 3-hydroxyacyl-CoA dehydrogenase family protein [Goekera deserti]NDI50111.1 3-hydroxyacyl-CoA dehydrogenase family protein [Goekera deserti]NEL52412.1 3-hydroxyacyl-CoA dehydrogenase family protein [Goekera deserti]
MARELTEVGVVGLGTMGAGIVEVLARAGLSVTAVDVDDDAVARGRAHVEQSTERAVTRGKLEDADRTAILERVRYTTTLADLGSAELVVEAVPERMDLKAQLFAELDRICPPDTILATNTSSLSVTALSVATGRPSKVIGMHFFNPAPVMKLVEIVRTVVTEPGVVEDVEALAARLGKVDVTIGDKAGFIANALLFGYLNHAVEMVENRYASREDVDAAMRLGCGLPMGPLALMDLIGIDTAYEILQTMYQQSRDRLHAPRPLIKQMMTAGLLGRKSGRGFYTYAERGSAEVVPDAATPSAAGAAEGARPFRSVGVVGSGTMATGIIEVVAKGGLDVRFVARTDEKVAAVLAALTRSLDKQVARGRLDEATRDAVLARVDGTTSLDELADRELVIEAVVESLQVKQTLFAALGEITKPGTVLATTTSSLPVIECAKASERPEDVVGLHFFNPAQVMKLVEVVSTIATAPDVAATAHALCQQLGKHAVSCADRAGFIVNALLFPYLNDAVRMLEAHYASSDDIDAAMKVGCGYPMGPFELLDVVGLDVSLAIERELYTEFREPGYAPAPLLEHLVTAGYLGRKTGRGFRDHSTR